MSSHQQDAEVALTGLGDSLFEYSSPNSEVNSIWDFMAPILPKTWLLVTEDSILELAGMVLRSDYASVTKIYPLESLQKLNFRRGKYSMSVLVCC